MKKMLLVLLAIPNIAICNSQTGIASWYGSSNVPLIKSSNQMRAAHKTLKLGSKALVTSHATHKSVVVTIVDRGPYKNNRIIDLNKTAAKYLGFIAKGVTMVTVTPLHNS